MPRTSASQPRRRDGGSVTAEFAVNLPAVVLALLLVLCAATVGRAQLQCMDAARAGARQAARAEADGRAVQVARSAAPEGAQIVLSRDDETASVVVRARIQVPFPGGLTFQVASRSVAALESAEGLR